MGYDIRYNIDELETDSDLRVLLVDKKVSVTPISIDLTSRTDYMNLRSLLTDNDI